MNNEVSRTRRSRSKSSYSCLLNRFFVAIPVSGHLSCRLPAWISPHCFENLPAPYEILTRHEMTGCGYRNMGGNRRGRTFEKQVIRNGLWWVRCWSPAWPAFRSGGLIVGLEVPFCPVSESGDSSSSYPERKGKKRTWYEFNSRQ